MAPAPPKITKLVATASKTAVTLTASLDSNAVYAGTVYCGIFAASAAAPTGLTRISSQGFYASYASNVRTASVTVTGLIPLTSYVAYCYVRTTQGYESTLSDALSTKVSLTTSCCKTVGFTNAPTSIYSDSSKYTASTSKNTYSFSLSLDYAPSVSLSVSPVLTYVTSGKSVPATWLRSSTSSISFTSSSQSLTSSFILVAANKTVSGTYSLSLSLSGDSAAEYNTSSVTVKMLSSYDMPATPTLKTLVFGDSGADAYLVFDSSTNLGGLSLSVQWTCTSLFYFSGANVTACTWLNSTAVRAVFPTLSSAQYTSTLPKVGSTISVALGSQIRAACTVNNATFCGTFPVVDSWKTYAFSSAFNPVSPSVVLRVPASVGACDNVTVDASLSSGSAGRVWSTVSWAGAVISGSASKEEILSRLKSVGLQQSVNKQLTLPRSLFSPGKYTISLTLTNYFGLSSTATAAFSVDSNAYIPKLSFVGASSRTIKANDALTLYSKASFSSCTSTASNSVKMVYTWTVYKVTDSAYTVVPVTTFSRDASVLSLSAYSLSAGSTYRVAVNATVFVNSVQVADSVAYAAVTVSSGSIVASVTGGSVRQVGLDSSVTLALSAYDEDTLSTSHLRYSWSCRIASVSFYGADCKSIFSSNTSLASVTVSGAAMNYSYSYLLSAVAYTTTGRSSSTVSVSVVPVAAGSPVTRISSSLQKFNVDSNFSLSGFVSASYDVDVAWSAYIGGSNVSFVAYSASRRTIAASKVSGSSAFPFTLLVGANSFTAGASVTFRLFAQLATTPASAASASRTRTRKRRHDSGMIEVDLDLLADSSSLSSYSEISIVANAAPTGGSLSSTPSNGYGLSTAFTIMSTGWTDDPSDYPLAYTFRYALSAASPSLTIQSLTTSSSVSTHFPAGLSSENFALTLTCVVYDYYNATANAATTVKVETDTTVDVSSYLSSGLTNALASGDPDTALQTMNNAASTINVINCTAVPPVYCASLNRNSCVSVPNTCGSCLSGYTGIVGAANTKCFDSSTASNVGAIGSPCLVNDDCIYGNCTAGVCVPPIKSCPSSSDSSCSGQGTCTYLDAANQPLAYACTVFDVFCRAKCVCADGYGGADCSLSPSAALSRDSQRASLCDGITTVFGLSSLTSSLLDSLISSLAVSYVPEEVVTTDTTKACSDAMALVTAFAGEGYLSSGSGTAAMYLVDSVSKFFSSSSDIDESTISSALTSLTSALLSTSVDGQDPLSITSDNVRIAIRRDLIDDLTSEDASLSPPLTSEESQYGISAPSLQFNASSAASACANGNGYAEMAIAQYGVNPYANASAAKTPIMRVSSTTGGSSRRRLDLFSGDNEVAYYLTVQFSTVQDFNMSYTADDINQARALNVSLGNATFPECGYYEDGRYSSCGACNISTYTNYNVTFACYDVSDLCSSTSTTTRRLSQFVSDFEAARTDGDASQSEWSQEERDLGLDVEGTTTRVKEIAALLVALEDALKDVLSANPFAMSWEDGKVIFSFVGTLVLFLGGMAVYFHRWDSYDRHQLIYNSTWPPKREGIRKHLMDVLFNKKKTLRAREKAQAEEDAHDDIVRPDLARQESRTEKLAREKSLKRSKSKSWSWWWPFSRDTVAAKEQVKDKKLAKSLAEIAKNEAIEKRKNKFKFHRRLFSTNVSEFFDMVMPEMLQHNLLFAFIHAVLIKHDMTSIFVRPSTAEGRFFRWMSFVKTLLIGLFVDTLFFQIFYFNDGTCEGNETETDCLVAFNEVTSQPKCSWSTSRSCYGNTCETVTSCTLAEPPQDAIFTIMLALVTMILSVPLEILFSFILDHYCSKRPDIEMLGLNPAYWLGGWVNYHETLTDKEVNVENSKLGELFAKAETCALKHGNDGMKRLVLAILTRSNDSIMRDYGMPDEELQTVLVRVMEHFEESSRIYTHLSELEQVAWKEAHEAQSASIVNHLGIRSDGTYRPLSLKERIFFKNPRERLLKRIIEVRRQEKELLNTMMLVGPMSKHLQEVTLLHSWILEQFTPFKKWLLNAQFFCFEGLGRPLINPLDWILCWIFVIGGLAFFVYWILAWGAINGGGAILKNWGINFVLSTLEDIFFIQLMKIFIMFIIVAASIKPQLESIRSHLKEMATEYIQGHVPIRRQLRKSEFSVIQHVSPSCRVSWRKVGQELAMGKMLRQVDDYDSKKCRANRDRQLGFVGVFVFLLPIAIALFGEAAADITMDMIMPSLTSAFLVLNAALYNVSIVVLMIPYFIFMGFLIYRFYFIPNAKKRMLKYRAKKMEKKKLDIPLIQRRQGLRQSHIDSYCEESSVFEPSMMASVGYVFNRAIVNPLLKVVFVTNPLWVRKDRKEKIKEAPTRWFAMNLPEHLQGYTTANSLFTRNTDASGETEAEREEHRMLQRVLYKPIPGRQVLFSLIQYLSRDLLYDKNFKVDTTVDAEKKRKAEENSAKTMLHKVKESMGNLIAGLSREQMLDNLVGDEENSESTHSNGSGSSHSSHFDFDDDDSSIARALLPPLRIPHEILTLRNSNWVGLIEDSMEDEDYFVDVFRRHLLQVPTYAMVLEDDEFFQLCEPRFTPYHRRAEIEMPSGGDEVSGVPAMDPRHKQRVLLAKMYMDKYQYCYAEIQSTLKNFMRFYLRDSCTARNKEQVMSVLRILKKDDMHADDWHNIRKSMMAEKVTIVSAKTVLEQIFEVFRPEGHRFSVAEVEEVVEEFHLFMKSQDRAAEFTEKFKPITHSRSTKKLQEEISDIRTEAGRQYALLVRSSSTGTAIGVSRLPFNMFFSWFEERLYKFIIHYRYLDDRRLPRPSMNKSKSYKAAVQAIDEWHAILASHGETDDLDDKRSLPTDLFHSDAEDSVETEAHADDEITSQDSKTKRRLKIAPPKKKTLRRFYSHGLLGYQDVANEVAQEMLRDSESESSSGSEDDEIEEVLDKVETELDENVDVAMDFGYNHLNGSGDVADSGKDADLYATYPSHSDEADFHFLQTQRERQAVTPAVKQHSLKVEPSVSIKLRPSSPAIAHPAGLGESSSLFDDVFVEQRDQSSSSFYQAAHSYEAHLLLAPTFSSSSDAGLDSHRSIAVTDNKAIVESAAVNALTQSDEAAVRTDKGCAEAESVLSSDSDSDADFDLQEHELFYISSSDILSRESSTASDTNLPPVVGSIAIAALNASEDTQDVTSSPSLRTRSPPVSPRGSASEDVNCSTGAVQSNQFFVSQRLGIAELSVLEESGVIGTAETTVEAVTLSRNSGLRDSKDDESSDEGAVVVVAERH